MTTLKDIRPNAALDYAADRMLDENNGDDVFTVLLVVNKRRGVTSENLVVHSIGNDSKYVFRTRAEALTACNVVLMTFALLHPDTPAAVFYVRHWRPMDGFLAEPGMKACFAAFEESATH